MANLSSLLYNSNSGSNDGATNPYYRAYLSKGSSATISTPLPENWTTQLDIEWSPQFAGLMQGIIGELIGDKRASTLATVGAGAGYAAQNKSLTSNVWGGKSYMAMQIPFIFKVEKSVQEEMINPINQLLSWALPKEVTMVGVSVGLKAPYAPMVDYKGAPDSTSVSTDANIPLTLQFGNFFTLPQCVITSISQTYDTILNKDGYPLSAKVDVSLMSVQIITSNDIPKMYPASPGINFTKW